MERTFMPMGSTVICDLCNGDYTESEESGGFMFGSYATCPACAPDVEKRARTNGELGHIGGRCPKGKSFADWIRELRGEGAGVEHISFDSDEEMFAWLQAQQEKGNG